MEEGFRLWANPSSPHAEGRKARALLEDARERIKAALGWEGELIFTSGASEAAALALGRDNPERLLTFGAAFEHDAIFDHVDYLNRTSHGGAFDLEHLEQHLQNVQWREDQGLWAIVSVQMVNSETGNRQDPTSAADLVKERGAMLLVDAAQAAGKFTLPLCDAAILSAHKFGGPIGMGALLVRSFGLVVPSGGQERGYRRGTENLPGALAMAAALEACGDPYLDRVVLEPLVELAEECRKVGGFWLSDHLSDPTPYIRAVAMPNLSAAAQVMRFDMAGISVSQGSACSSGTMKVSRVLTEALGVEREVAERTIRISFGWNTTRAEVERFCEVWLELARA